jgi:fatty-acyl-CoA synthase
VIPSEKWVEKPLASIVLMNNEDSVSDEESSFQETL